MIKNKRANIPVTILVLGVLVVCGLAIFSFVLGNNQIKGDISDISIIENVKLDVEKFGFYMDKTGFESERIKTFLFVEETEYGESIIKEKGNLKVIYPLS